MVGVKKDVNFQTRTVSPVGQAGVRSASTLEGDLAEARTYGDAITLGDSVASFWGHQMREEAKIKAQQEGIKYGARRDPSGKLIPPTEIPDLSTTYGRTFYAAAGEQYIAMMRQDAKAHSSELVLKDPRNSAAYSAKWGEYTAATLEGVEEGMRAIAAAELDSIGKAGSVEVLANETQFQREQQFATLSQDAEDRVVEATNRTRLTGNPLDPEVQNHRAQIEQSFKAMEANGLAKAGAAEDALRMFDTDVEVARLGHSIDKMVAARQHHQAAQLISDWLKSENAAIPDRDLRGKAAASMLQEVNRDYRRLEQERIRNDRLKSEAQTSFWKEKRYELLQNPDAYSQEEILSWYETGKVSTLDGLLNVAVGQANQAEDAFNTMHNAELYQAHDLGDISTDEVMKRARFRTEGQRAQAYSALIRDDTARTKADIKRVLKLEKEIADEVFRQMAEDHAAWMTEDEFLEEFAPAYVAKFGETPPGIREAMSRGRAKNGSWHNANRGATQLARNQNMDRGQWDDYLKTIYGTESGKIGSEELMAEIAGRTGHTHPDYGPNLKSMLNTRQGFEAAVGHARNHIANANWRSALKSQDRGLVKDLVKAVQYSETYEPDKAYDAFVKYQEGKEGVSYQRTVSMLTVDGDKFEDVDSRDLFLRILKASDGGLDGFLAGIKMNPDFSDDVRRWAADMDAAGVSPRSMIMSMDPVTLEALRHDIVMEAMVGNVANSQDAIEIAKDALPKFLSRYQPTFTPIAGKDLLDKAAQFFGVDTTPGTSVEIRSQNYLVEWHESKLLSSRNTWPEGTWSPQNEKINFGVMMNTLYPEGLSGDGENWLDFDYVFEPVETAPGLPPMMRVGRIVDGRVEWLRNEDGSQWLYDNRWDRTPASMMEDQLLSSAQESDFWSAMLRIGVFDTGKTGMWITQSEGRRKILGMTDAAIRERYIERRPPASNAR